MNNFFKNDKFAIKNTTDNNNNINFLNESKDSKIINFNSSKNCSSISEDRNENRESSTSNEKENAIKSKNIKDSLEINKKNTKSKTVSAIKNNLISTEDYLSKIKSKIEVRSARNGTQTLNELNIPILNIDTCNNNYNEEERKNQMKMKFNFNENGEKSQYKNHLKTNKNIKKMRSLAFINEMNFLSKKKESNPFIKLIHHNQKEIDIKAKNKNKGTSNENIDEYMYKASLRRKMTIKQHQLKRMGQSLNRNEFLMGNKILQKEIDNNKTFDLNVIEENQELIENQRRNDKKKSTKKTKISKKSSLANSNVEGVNLDKSIIPKYSLRKSKFSSDHLNSNEQSYDYSENDSMEKEHDKPIFNKGSFKKKKNSLNLGQLFKIKDDQLMKIFEIIKSHKYIQNTVYKFTHDIKITDIILTIFSTLIVILSVIDIEVYKFKSWKYIEDLYSNGILSKGTLEFEKNYIFIQNLETYNLLSKRQLSKIENVLRKINLVLVALSCLFLLAKYYMENKKMINEKKIPHNYNICKSNLIYPLIIEIILNIIICPYSINYVHIGNQKDVLYAYPLNIIIFPLVCIRLYRYFVLIFNYCYRYNSNVSRAIIKNYSKTNSYSFPMKCGFHSSPFFISLMGLLFIDFFFGYIISSLEEFTNDKFFKYYGKRELNLMKEFDKSLLLILNSVSHTVYGDLVPMNIFSRLTLIVSCFIGQFFICIFIYNLNLGVDFEGNEGRAYTRLTKLFDPINKEHKAANVIKYVLFMQKFIKTRRIFKNKKYIQDKELAEIKNNCLERVNTILASCFGIGKKNKIKRMKSLATNSFNNDATKCSLLSGDINKTVKLNQATLTDEIIKKGVFSYMKEQSDIKQNMIKSTLNETEYIIEQFAIKLGFITETKLFKNFLIPARNFSLPLEDMIRTLESKMKENLYQFSKKLDCLNDLEDDLNNIAYNHNSIIKNIRQANKYYKSVMKYLINLVNDNILDETKRREHLKEISSPRKRKKVNKKANNYVKCNSINFTKMKNLGELKKYFSSTNITVLEKELLKNIKRREKIYIDINLNDSPEILNRNDPHRSKKSNKTSISPTYERYSIKKKNRNRCYSSNDSNDIKSKYDFNKTSTKILISDSPDANLNKDRIIKEIEEEDKNKIIQKKFILNFDFKEEDKLNEFELKKIEENSDYDESEKDDNLAYNVKSNYKISN